MRTLLALFSGLALAAQEPARLPERLLFVGEKAHAGRASEFTDFLQRHFASVAATTHEGFTAAAAKDADVVLLDWHTGEDWARARSPLGALDGWSKPVVLLGSAGLNTAIAWNVLGGFG
ncbi:MAG TPA: hypothetical protein VF384_15530 [Planctomycetota bacterium]